jgi:hypothetical protein
MSFSDPAWDPFDPVYDGPPTVTHLRDDGVVQGDPELVVHMAVAPQVRYVWFNGAFHIVSTRIVPTIVVHTYQGQPVRGHITGICRDWYRWDMYSTR